MADNKNIIFFVILIIAGLFLLQKTPFFGAVFSFDDLSSDEIPRGVGYDAMSQVPDNKNLPDALICENAWGICSNEFNQAVCCYDKPSGDRGPLFPALKLNDISGWTINPTNVLSIELSGDEPSFFEDDFVTFTIKTNPSDLQPPLNNCALGICERFVVAWWERDVPEGENRELAIKRFGKPVDYTDLSRFVNLENSQQEFTFDIGELPIGEYRVYVAFGEYIAPQRFHRLSNYLLINFLVNPKPLTLGIFEGDIAPEGYDFQKDSENENGKCNPSEGSKTCVVVRTDLKDLPCARLGCPITVDPETGEIISYVCGSDGFCSEPIFQYAMCESDSDCPEGMKCEPSSGICFNEEIIEIILQCKEDSDCFDPNCKDSDGDEVTAQCLNDRCSYSGQCDVQLQDCTTLGCPPTFICEETTGSCIRTEEAPDDEFKPEEKPPLLRFPGISNGILIALGIILIIVIFFFKGRKGK